MHAAPSVTAWGFRASALIAGKKLHSNPLNSVHDQRTVLYGGGGVFGWGGRRGAPPRARRSLEKRSARPVPVARPRGQAAPRAGVSARNQHVERQPDRKVRAHRGVDRDETDLERVIKVGVVGDGAIEDRLAVFVLADLQIGRVLGAFDEVPRGIEQEEPRALALDLSAEQ